jgi:hypothetical protein
MNEFDFTKIDSASHLPLFIQLKEQLKKNIEDKQLPEGAKLPSLSQLTKLTGLGLQTCNRALDELIKDEVCFRRPKKGTFVGSGNSVQPPGGPKKNICIFYHDLDDDNFRHNIIHTSMYQGAMERFRQENTDMVFITAGLEEAIDFYCNRDVFSLKGVLILMLRAPDNCFETTRKYPQLRFVFLNYFYPCFEYAPENV